MSSDSPHELLNPRSWKPARGYSNGVAASGRTLFLGGMIGWNGDQEFASDDFIAQTEQALRNIVEVLSEGGAGPEHLVRLTWYVSDCEEYLARLRELGGVYRSSDEGATWQLDAKGLEAPVLVLRDAEGATWSATAGGVYSREHDLFSDGFESGDLSKWISP